MKKILTWSEVRACGLSLSQDIICNEKTSDSLKIYGIPRGGIFAALVVIAANPTKFSLVDTPEEADLYVDDIYDTGSTYKEWSTKYPGKSFYVLIDKRMYEWAGRWIVLPWEDETRLDDDTVVGTITNRLRRNKAPFTANDNISGWILDSEEESLFAEVTKRAENFLRGLIIDLDNDPNTKDTAHRMAKMYLKEVFAGRYTTHPKLTSFPNTKKLDEMFITGPITVRSTCSHHLQPIIGECYIGVVPGDTVFGLSKFNRIVEWFASRPQIQEELVIQVADFLEAKLKPKGIAVVIKAKHHCMVMRGVKESEANMTTNVMRGVFMDPTARAEFLSMLK